MESPELRNALLELDDEPATFGHATQTAPGTTSRIGAASYTPRSQATDSAPFDPEFYPSWLYLTGDEFEWFLARLFRRQGYTVQLTGQSGDQGVDLILIAPRGRKIAVQAKGYIVSSVGNKAVQEAYTGRAYYDCDECWVVTTSVFTKKAREVADKVGCRLFDRHAVHQWLRRLRS